MTALLVTGAGCAAGPRHVARPAPTFRAEPVFAQRNEPAGPLGLVHLHIEGASGLVLDGAARCEAPCDRQIDGRAGARFYFRGPSLPDSERFELRGFRGRVIARVQPGSAWQRPAGFVLLGVGIYGLLGAVESVIVGAVLAEAVRAPRDADVWFVSGAASAGVGAGLTALGLWLAARGRTTFELVPATASSR